MADVSVPPDPVHNIIYDAVMRGLAAGAPGLTEAGRTPIAINAAVRACKQLRLEGHVAPLPDRPFDALTMERAVLARTVMKPVTS